MNYLTKEDKIIYQEEFADKLPAKIFDAHVHIWDKSSFPENFSFPELSWAKAFNEEFSLQDWRNAMNELLPEQKVELLGFGMPNNAADRTEIISPAPDEGYASVLISPEDSLEKLDKSIQKSNAVGVKPYLNYAADFYKKKLADLEVKDLITEEQLQYLNREKLAVTMHIPRSLRFADELNKKQMLELCLSYPDISFIFAHIGRAYYMRNIEQSNLQELAECKNAFFDTAMINHNEVLSYTFDHFPAERIIFGTDAPIALLHGKSVEINNQYAYLTQEEYNIGTAIFDSKKSVVFTTFFYEQLRAILKTAPKNKLQDIFYNNAKQLFTRIAEK